MAENNVNIEIRNDFNQIFGIISYHRQRVSKTIDDESLRMIWEVGGYISHKLKNAEWGAGIVRQLSEFIRTQDPTIKGWSYRTIYKMVQFYDTYSTDSFCQLLETTNLPKLFTNKNSDKNSQFVRIELAQIQLEDFVPIQLAQIPYVLFSTGWSNHQLILNRCKSAEERLFYIIYSKFEHLEYKQLERAIKTDTMASILRAKDSQSDVLHTTYTKSPAMFKDTAYLDFLGLPKKYKETRLRKGIVKHMKEFILEMGKDFLFIDEEHPIKVGGKTYKVDLLFYHRQLQCMVAFELKPQSFIQLIKGNWNFILKHLTKRNVDQTRTQLLASFYVKNQTWKPCVLLSTAA